MLTLQMWGVAEDERPIVEGHRPSANKGVTIVSEDGGVPGSEVVDDHPWLGSNVVRGWFRVEAVSRYADTYGGRQWSSCWT